jgi:hypothetical protein
MRCGVYLVDAFLQFGKLPDCLRDCFAVLGTQQGKLLCYQ